MGLAVSSVPFATMLIALRTEIVVRIPSCNSFNFNSRRVTTIIGWFQSRLGI